MSLSSPVVLFVAALAALACSDFNSPVSPGSLLVAPESRDGKVAVCHIGGSHARIIEVSPYALTGHLRHGDYPATLRVDPGHPVGREGIDFARITDAVRAVRMVRLARAELDRAACRITIVVAPGVRTGTFDEPTDPSLEQYPLILDVPDITLRGGLDMTLDPMGRATGMADDEAAVAVLAPDRPLRDVPLFEAMILVIGHPGGSWGNGVIIEGFSFQSGHPSGGRGGIGILSLRTQSLVVRSNRFEAGLTSGMDLRATSARVEGNYAQGLGLSCAMCLAGPGDYQVAGNRILSGGLGGLYVAPSVTGLGFSLGADPDMVVEPGVPPSFAEVTATITNNDVRGHLRKPIGFALRILAVGPGMPDVPQSARVIVRGNDFVGNTFGLVMDAGFPVANSLLKGDLNVSTEGNRFTPSCQRGVLVAFTRHTGALGTTVNPYLQNSLITLQLADVDWSDVWYSHPAGFGNTLTVDGTEIANGSLVAFDPALPCPTD